jgi:hypothetical protein
MATSPTQERSSSSSRLSIRVVPYSPPRLSSDGASTASSSRAVSYAESSSRLSGLESSFESNQEILEQSRASAEPHPDSDVSGLRRSQGSTSPSRPTALVRPRTSNASSNASSARRPRKVITINPDKTFSLVPHTGSTSSRTDSSFVSPRSSYRARTSSHRSSDAFLDETPTTPLTPLTEKPSNDSLFPPPQRLLTPLTASGNFLQLSGGLRRVPSTPEGKLKQPEPSISSAPAAVQPPTPTYTRSKPPAVAPLSAKSSVSSLGSDSANSQQPNYQVFAKSSPVAATPSNYAIADSDLESLPPSSSDSNYQILGQSSSAAPSSLNQSRPQTGDANHQVLSQSSSASPSSRDPLRPPTSDANYQILSQSSSAGPSSRDHSPAPTSEANYQVLSQSSSAGPSSRAQSRPQTSDPNYEILGQSSPVAPSNLDQSRPQTSDTNVNYVVYGGASASSLSLVSTNSNLNQKYSRESLIVPPLRTVKRRASDSTILSKASSIKSLRTARTGSFSSFSNIITQEATRALFVGATLLNIQPSFPRSSSRIGTTNQTARMQPIMPSYPHQWSSQLSTVASESEGGSEPATRSVSPLSAPGRRSSGFNSSHSRQMLSISSSLAAYEDSPSAPSHSRSGSLDRPQAAHNRNANSSNIRLVRDHDEDGDGLADLQDLHHRPSRSRLTSLSSSHSTDRNIWTSSSSRANSISSQRPPAMNGIPRWARVYYGSGEHRVLFKPSSDSLYSQFNDSRPASAFLSPGPRDQSANLYGQREPGARPRSSRHGSMDITSSPLWNAARAIRRQTSSLWSPHLQQDKRPTRYSMWEPPSDVWSDEAGIASRRNVQVIMFVIGFVFPFAWMIGAVLPLPLVPQAEMAERLESSSDLDLHRGSLPQGPDPVTAARYRGAYWWRNVNRMMSVIGLLVIGAVVALIILGVREQWGR